MNKFFLQLRSGGFLTRERMRLWAAGLVLGLVASLVFLGLTAQGISDYAGRPLGTDFSNVYAAGVAASHGDPAAPFDAMRQLQAERELFGPATPFYGWHYPPFFLLIAAALAQLAYIPALIVWQLGSLLLYLGAMALLLRRSAAPALARDRLWLLLTLGFSAVFVNLLHGQNGFLTTALFAAGLALLDERPLLAGLLFGLLCYKPQFAVLIPLVLAVTGRWKTLLSGAASVGILAAAVTALFGASVWPAFMNSLHFTRTVVLEQGGTGFYKMQSAFALVRLWHGSIALAYGVQLFVALGVVIALLQIWRGASADGYKKAALCLAALLLTPYGMDYDLMLLAPAIALMAAEGRAGRFADFELLLLTVLWCVPIIARNIAHYTLVPLGVPVMLISLSFIWRRCSFAQRSGCVVEQPKIPAW